MTEATDAAASGASTPDKPAATTAKGKTPAPTPDPQPEAVAPEPEAEKVKLRLTTPFYDHFVYHAGQDDEVTVNATDTLVDPAIADAVIAEAESVGLTIVQTDIGAEVVA